MEISWNAFYEAVGECRACRLCEKRTTVVPGEGNPKAELMLIGEGPGQQEDLTGHPFVGPAGQLLDKMLGAIGLDREQVYICNIVKCRPPSNRVPEPDERQACLIHLRRQFVLVRPKIILCLGSTPSRTLIGDQIRVTRDRGVWHAIKGVWFMPTYHPAALLRDPAKKREAWEDLKAVRSKLDELRGGTDHD